jgi:hypothetical protein
MEFFDYGLWNANIQGRCYDLVIVSGTITVTGTALSIYSMIWYNRKSGGLNDWDAKLFFLCICVTGILLLLQNETNGEFLPLIPIPNEPYRGSRPSILSGTFLKEEYVSRNVWFTDNILVAIVMLPLYLAPVIRGAWDNFSIPQKIFGRCVAHSSVLSLLGLIGAFITNIVAFGSVWCFVTGFQLILFDIHVFLSHQETKDVTIHPFGFKSIKKKQ